MVDFNVSIKLLLYKLLSNYRDKPFHNLYNRYRIQDSTYTNNDILYCSLPDAGLIPPEGKQPHKDYILYIALYQLQLLLLLSPFLLIYYLLFLIYFSLFLACSILDSGCSMLDTGKFHIPKSKMHDRFISFAHSTFRFFCYSISG